jgi:hypothetical protein
MKLNCKEEGGRKFLSQKTLNLKRKVSADLSDNLIDDLNFLGTNNKISKISYKLMDQDERLSLSRKPSELENNSIDNVVKPVVGQIIEEALDQILETQPYIISPNSSSSEDYFAMLEERKKPESITSKGNSIFKKITKTSSKFKELNNIRVYLFDSKEHIDLNIFKDDTISSLIKKTVNYISENNLMKLQTLNPLG